MQLLIRLFLVTFIFTAQAFTQECKVQITPVQDGVNEAVFDSVRVKFESMNKLAKMKMVGATGSEDWTSVSTEGDQYSQINGFEGNGDTARLLYQMIVKQEGEEFKWAMFKLEKRSAAGGIGTAFFVSQNQVTCGTVSLHRWVGLVTEIFKGRIAFSAAINLERDSL